MSLIDYNVERLEFSEDGLANVYFFYKDLNEINIFVEDLDKEYEYETIFKRLFSEKYIIKKIFTTGGKPKLIERFQEFGTHSGSDLKVKNFYIADGDFDRIIDSENMINHNQFIYLETYNIENYFVDEVACLTFIKGFIKKLDSEVEQLVNYEQWLNHVVSNSKDLFFLHSCVKKHHPSIQNVSRPNYFFIDVRTGLVLKDKIDLYKNEIMALDSEIEEKIKSIEVIYMKIFGDNYFNLICGKYLFDSFYSHLSNLTVEKFSKFQLRWALICNFEINKLEYVKNKILSLS